MEELNANLEKIRGWIGTRSINIFGMPFSGKDTHGTRLAEELHAKFLSSGQILRDAAESGETGDWVQQTEAGELTPTNDFFRIVLPYLEKRELWDYPLVLASIGRWKGEEDAVMQVAKGAGHEIMFAVNLMVSEEEVRKRYLLSQSSGDRSNRADDADLNVLYKRLDEFRTKTVPVLERYDELDMLINVSSEGTKEEVFARIVKAIADRI